MCRTQFIIVQSLEFYECSNNYIIDQEDFSSLKINVPYVYTLCSMRISNTLEKRVETCV